MAWRISSHQAVAAQPGGTLARISGGAYVLPSLRPTKALQLPGHPVFQSLVEAVLPAGVRMNWDRPRVVWTPEQYCPVHVPFAVAYDACDASRRLQSRKAVLGDDVPQNAVVPVNRNRVVIRFGHNWSKRVAGRSWSVPALEMRKAYLLISILRVQSSTENLGPPPRPLPQEIVVWVGTELLRCGNTVTLN